MNHVRKLALHGMRGRRKDTRVLALVIVMSFFISDGGDAAAVLLQREPGTAAPEPVRRLAPPVWRRGFQSGGESDGPVPGGGDCRGDPPGVDGQCGQVAAWSEDFARMGSLQIVEGRAPEAAGEILLEQGPAGPVSEETGVGSTVTPPWSII